jgi:26S proteasome regulatory subunit N2
MYSGTTTDTFLRENFEWLRQATNWAKFSAIASLGVIQKGQISSSKTILDIYLPKGNFFVKF